MLSILKAILRGKITTVYYFISVYNQLLNSKSEFMLVNEKVATNVLLF